MVLKLLKPQLGTIKPALATSRQEREQRRLREREQNTDYRRWYKLKRWERLRQAVFVRDNYTCQATGIVLVGKHPADNSPVCDHKIPHNGDPELFWSIDNLQTVSKGWHDSAKQSAERAERKVLIG